jgi:hypothetical protein
MAGRRRAHEISRQPLSHPFQLLPQGGTFDGPQALPPPHFTARLRCSYASRRSNAGSWRKPMLKRSLLLILLLAAVATAGHSEDARKGQQSTLTLQHSGTKQLLIAVSPVDSKVVWAARVLSKASALLVPGGTYS